MRRMPHTLAGLVKPLSVGSRVAGGFLVHALDEERASVVLEREGARLVLQVRARDDRRGRFAATRTFNLTYVGTSLQPDEDAALRSVIERIQANDDGVALDAVAQQRPQSPSVPRVAPETTVTPENGRLMVRLSSTCEMSCVFCTRGAGGSLSKPRPLSDPNFIERELQRHAHLGGTVVFGGDEPMTYPELPRLVAFARKVGFERFELVTSGQTLSRVEAVKSIRALGIVRVELPIYGASAAVHDAVTQVPGSFAALCTAADLLRSNGIEVDFHSLIVRQNLADVVAVRDLVATRYGAQLGFAHVMPRSESVDDFAAKMPRYRELISALAGRGVALHQFPSCVVARVNPAQVERSAKAFDGDRRVKPPEVCAGCPAAERCPGTYPQYLAAYGADGLARFERNPTR